MKYHAICAGWHGSGDSKYSAVRACAATMHPTSVIAPIFYIHESLSLEGCNWGNIVAIASFHSVEDAQKCNRWSKIGLGEPAVEPVRVYTLKSPEYDHLLVVARDAQSTSSLSARDFADAVRFGNFDAQQKEVVFRCRLTHQMREQIRRQEQRAAWNG